MVLAKSQAVFSITIDQASNCERLEPHRSYYYREIEGKTTYKEIQDFCVGIINKELKTEVEELVPLPIKTIEVKKEYEGSIVLIFQVVFNIFQFVAGIRDFYDSVELIKKISEKHLHKRLKEHYGDVFSVDTRSLTSHDRYDFDDMVGKRKYNHRLALILNAGSSKRDAFFYYLLISNIVLLAIVIALVFRAVMQTYF